MKMLAVRLGTFATLLACLVRPAIADAPAGRYTYTSTSVTVYDTKTKLTWQRAATAAQYAMADAKTYCGSPATATALGGSGWRLPTLKELQSLIDFSKDGRTVHRSERIFRGRPSRPRLVCDRGCRNNGFRVVCQLHERRLVHVGQHHAVLRALRALAFDDQRGIRRRSIFTDRGGAGWAVRASWHRSPRADSASCIARCRSQLDRPVAAAEGVEDAGWYDCGSARPVPRPVRRRGQDDRAHAAPEHCRRLRLRRLADAHRRAGALDGAGVAGRQDPGGGSRGPARARRPVAGRGARVAASGAVQAFAYARTARSIVHRDIKPANIVVVAGDAGDMGVEGGGLLRVLDFGIAKVVADDEVPGSGLTRTAGSSAFSPHYAAPEQVAHGRTGPWTDVHALGLLLTELLTDQPPYTATDMQLFEEAMAQVRPTPGTRGRNVGPWEAILARAVALSPGARWKDAGDLVAALEATVPKARWRRRPAPARQPPAAPSSRGP